MKIVFLNCIYNLPIPSTMGGGAEELLTLLLNENEKSNGNHQFYFVQKMLYGDDKKYLPVNKYQNSHLVFVKYNRFVTFIQRSFSKFLKILKLKKNTPTYFPFDYHRQALKVIKNINPDLIIFEGQIDANIKKYQKLFGINRLYVHIHIQDLEKTQMHKNVKGIIAVSNFVKDDYNTFLGVNAANMNNLVLPNCINEERFNKKIALDERKQIRAKLGFTEEDFVVVYVGRICQEKGVKELIRAVLKCNEKIKLMIVGGLLSIKKQTSPYIKDVQFLCDENSDRIKFTGYIKNSELYKYYQSADLQVVPSLCEEAAGLVVLEGQNCGLPQIVTKSGGMSEYITKDVIQLNRNETFVDNLAQTITVLSQDENRRKKIIKSGYENARKYTKANYYKNFVDMVEQINHTKSE